MDSTRIAELLAPFVSSLGHEQIAHLTTYLEMLRRWNAKLNLTAVRDPEQMVKRHFGESLFAAGVLFPQQQHGSLLDVGSGAGFPGLPTAIVRPQLRVTLLEAHGKKATFLREVIRALALTNVDVISERAEDSPSRAAVVTLRAIERFAEVLPSAANLAEPAGRLALLIGAAQVSVARELLPNWKWQLPTPVPESQARVILVGSRESS